MGLKRQLERLRHWVCPQSYDCLDCKDDNICAIQKCIDFVKKVTK